MHMRVSVLFDSGVRENYKAPGQNADAVDFLQKHVKEFLENQDPTKTAWIRVGEDIIDLKKVSSIRATLSFF